MKAILQRVSRGCVRVDGRTIGAIGPGLVVLLGVRTGDNESDAEALAHKTLNLRIFPDAAGRMNRSILDTGGSLLVVPQFTLYADTRKGNRPSFVQAARPEKAHHLYTIYVQALGRAVEPGRVQTGAFQTAMEVELVNEGPVTITLRTDR